MLPAVTNNNHTVAYNSKVIDLVGHGTKGVQFFVHIIILIIIIIAKVVIFIILSLQSPGTFFAHTKVHTEKELLLL